MMWNVFYKFVSWAIIYFMWQQISQPASGGSQFTALVPGILSHGMDAQWAAYYASQSTYQQQAVSTWKCLLANHQLYLILLIPF